MFRFIALVAMALWLSTIVYMAIKDSQRSYYAAQKN